MKCCPQESTGAPQSSPPTRVLQSNRNGIVHAPLSNGHSHHPHPSLLHTNTTHSAFLNPWRGTKGGNGTVYELLHSHPPISLDNSNTPGHFPCSIYWTPLHSVEGVPTDYPEHAPLQSTTPPPSWKVTSTIATGITTQSKILMWSLTIVIM